MAEFTANLRERLAAVKVAPAFAVRRVLALLDAILSTPAEAVALLAALEHLRDGVDDAALRRELLAVIDAHVEPTFRRLRDFSQGSIWCGRGPEQTLAYRVGRLEMDALRRLAEAALGEALDLRAFHDEILRQGALLFPVLRRNLEAWAAWRA